MKKQLLILSGLAILIALLCLACESSQLADNSTKKQPVDLVNPYMGNISHLLVPTFPTIHLPNSMLRVTPKRSDYTSVELQGLPLILTSHRGTSAFSLNPVRGAGEELGPEMDLSYDQELITPYSYSVYLDEQQVEVDFGLSHQAASYKLNFEGTAPAYLIISTKEGALNWDGEALSGYQELGNDTRVFLYLVPDNSPARVSTLQGSESTDGQQAEGRDACLLLEYGRVHRRSLSTMEYPLSMQNRPEKTWKGK